MKKISPLPGLSNFARFVPALLIVTAAFLPFDASASLMPVDLGTASAFAVLAGSGITVAGAVGSTHINGDIGTFPTTSITGFGNVVLNGTNHGGDVVTQLAKNDLVTGYNDAAGRTAGTTYAGGFDLGGLTLASGVYSDMSSLFLSGTLTLDAQADPDAVWIFQTGSTLITASNSIVALTGGAQACHVFWQVGSSATLGTNTDFMGNILALESITLDTGATADGRVLARNGAVTLDGNSITKPICSDDTTGGTGVHTVPENGGTLLLFGVTLVGLFGFKIRDERKLLV